MKKILLAIQRNCKPLVVLLILLKLLSIKAYGQELSFSDDTLNYRFIFRDRYDEALRFVSDNKWISDSLSAKGIDPKFAIAIVFPEIIRYSALQDKMEVNGLLTLYVQYGEKYTDFSVGRFQMKPSFAEQIENEIKSTSGIGSYTFNQSNTSQARIERVNRLNDLNWQVNYLVLFIQVMNWRYGNIKWNTLDEKLKFYATAYNSGHTFGEAKIRNRMYSKTFYTGLVKTDSCYCYALIAEDFYSSK